MKVIDEKIESAGTQPKLNEPPVLELDLDALIKFGVIERTVAVGPMQVTLRTLTEEERTKILSCIPSNVVDPLEQFKLCRKPLLAQSITKINNMDFSSPESKQKLLGVLDKLQSAVIDKLITEYVNLVSDQNTLLESGSKKNS